MSARRAARAGCAGWLAAGFLGAGLLLGHDAFAIGAEAPLEELTQGQWRLQDGLAQDTIYAILQTRDGFLWCGTRAGLSRFDGVRFVTFGREELQLDLTTRIHALAEDSSGALWLGTGSGELLRYQDGVFRRFAADEGLKGDGKAVGRIAGLAAGRNGELWVATYSEGVFRFRDGRFERIASTAGITSITRLALDAQGDLWIATIGKGIFRYRPGEPLMNLGRPEGLPNDYVSSVMPARGGGVWIATHSGICLWRDGRLEVFGAERGMTWDHVTALREDRAGNVWFASFGGGVQRLHRDGRVDTLPAGELARGAIVWDIYEDRSGMIWIGTVDEGLLLLAEGPFSTWRAYERTGLGSRLVTALAEDAAGTFWIGTRDAGLSWRRNGAAGPEFGRIGRPQGLPAEAVWALDYEEGADGGSVWIGTQGGLFRVAAGGLAGSRSAPVAAVALPEFAEPPAVQALAHDGGTRFVGTDHGLLVWPNSAAKPRRLLTRNAGLPADSVLDLELGPEGRLWIATAGGIAVLEGGLLHRVRDYDRLGAGQPLALHSDAEGTLWAVAGAGGLVRIAAGEAAHLTHADGLLDDNLYAIHEDREGRIWLGASSGILRIARADLEAKLDDRSRTLPQTLFDRSDGVDPGAIAAFGKRAVTGRDGRLHMATFGGVAVHDGDREGQPKVDPRPLIETVLVDGAALPPAAESRAPARLAGNHRHLAFELAAPLPHAGHNIRLRHRLSGVDRDWVEAGTERRAAYSGLPPGSYLFEVQASSPDGAYLEEKAAYAFVVEAGFWQSWRLPFLLVLFLSAAAWLFHRFRSHQVLARQRELDSRIAEATANIRILHRLLPLCGTCHKVRGDQGYWQQVETYLAGTSGLEFTHGLCPDCAGAMMAQMEEDAPAAFR